MRVGIDLDNTLACYDGVFHAAAVAQGLIPTTGVATDKVSVRDWLRAQGRDPDFTLLQGYVYGPGMDHVALYPGATEALEELARAGCELFIVSHRTRTPFAGPAYDLHEQARAFLIRQGLAGAAGRCAEGCVHIELTAEDKVARIADLAVDAFVDDLPEVLARPGFPPRCRKILFDPAGAHPSAPFERCDSWAAVARSLLAAVG